MTLRFTVLEFMTKLTSLAPSYLSPLNCTRGIDNGYAFPAIYSQSHSTRVFMSPEQVRKSKYLSWLLRHGAREEGVWLDEAGWTSLDEVLRVSGLSRQEIEEMVCNDPKRRLQIEDGRIRACQGHTPKSGVTADGLEASWQPYAADAPVWHGTSVAAAEQIAREGILPIGRTHVHCAPARDSIVGKRADVHLLLEIDPGKLKEAGLGLFVAPNGVVLARRIPREAISGLIPLTKRAKSQTAALRAALSLPPHDADAPTVSNREEQRPTPPDPDDSAWDRR
jgi:putative RNA 2'-phosphotransferase